MRAEARPLRRVWPWVVAAIAALAIVAVVVVLLNRPPATTPTAPTTEPSSSTPTPAVTESQPSGCIGGPNLDADMVLATQDAAPHTSNGAVEVAAAVTRWTQRGPLPTTDEAERFVLDVVAADAPAGFQNLAETVKGAPNYPTGVQAGQTFSVSMLEAMWHLEEVSEDRAVVSLGGRYVIDGALSPDHYWWTTWTMVWEDEVWKLVAGSTSRPWNELQPVGRTFTGDC